MVKSEPIFNLQQYIKWMQNKKFWTNLQYVPQKSEEPKQYPVIIIADLKVCYDGRERVCVEKIYLSDFNTYAKLNVKRLNDFDGEREFTILINDEQVDDDTHGVSFFPDNFNEGQQHDFICIASDRCVNSYAGKDKE